MTSILNKVMSFRNLSEAASPPHLEDEDTIVDDMEMESTIVSMGRMESIPNFADQGITNHTEILLELIHGPSIPIHIGKEQKLFTIPTRLLNYHSNIIAARISPATETLFLPNIHPHAFAHVYRWMYQDELDILAYCCTRTSASSETGWQEACTLLCRVFAAATYFGIGTLQKVAIEELKTVFMTAREAGMVTPVLPELVLEVWDWCVGEKEEEEDEGEGEGEEGAEGEGEEEGGEENILWHLVLAEMCLAFSNKPMPSFKDYDGCCKRIDPFRQAVGNAMADRIHFGEGRGEEGGGKRVKLDLDRGD